MTVLFTVCGRAGSIGQEIDRNIFVAKVCEKLIRFGENISDRSYLYYYRKNDIFGEALFKIYTDRELFVLAKKKCKVLFYKKQRKQLYFRLLR